MSGWLLDTCVLSELRKPRPDRHVIAWLAEHDELTMHLSALTIGEIQAGISQLPDSNRRKALQDWLDTDLKSRFGERILPIDAASASAWGRLHGEGRASGRPVPVIDGLLAATAKRFELTVVTRNVRHFEEVVDVVNPWGSDSGSDG